MREHAANLLRRAQTIEARAWVRLTAIPSVMVTGSSGYEKNFGRKNRKALAGMDSAKASADRLREAATKWSARADRDDPAAQAVKAKKKETRASAEASLNAYLCATIQVGDTVFYMGTAPILVKRVNRKSITGANAENYGLHEICRFRDTDEEAAAYRAWRDLQ
jgi:hypothetical protein